MPDLVYRTKIVLDDSSVETMKQSLNEIKALSQQATSGSGGGTSANNEKRQREIKRITDLIRLQTSELKNQRAITREIIQAQGVESKNAKKSISDLVTKTQALERNVEKQMSLSLSLDRTAQEQLSFNNAVTASRNALTTSQKTLENYRINMAMLGNQVGRNNKVFSGANQALFSFSDLVQDSAQFSQGFAQGMRAIGNNVGFTAELLIMMNRNAKAANMTFGQALLASFKSAAGALVVLNLAITLGTVLLDRHSKKARAAKEELNKFADVVNKIEGGFNDFADVLGSETVRLLPLVADQVATQVDRYATLQQSLMDVKKAQTDLNNEVDNSLLISEDQIQRSEVLASVRSDIEEAMKNQGEATGILASLGKEELEAIRQRITEFNEEKRLREALRDLIIANIDAKQADIMVDKARASVLNNEVKPVILDAMEEINAALSGTTFDTGEAAGSLAFDLSIMRELQQDFSNAVTDIERQAIAQRIILKQQEIDAKRALLNKDVENTKNAEARKRQAVKNTNEFILNTERSLAQERLSINRNVQNALASLSQVFERDNKGLALGILALEKGLAIAEVVIDGTKRAAQATATGAALLANPTTAPLAGNAFAQVAVIKASTAAAVAAIAAQGLAQGATTIQQGAFSGSAASAGLTNPNQGVSITENERRPLFVPTNERQSQKPMFIIENRIDRKGIATMVRDGERQIRATQTANS